MDTIAAISTPPGVGGIGIIRMSGENCFEILKKMFKSKREEKEIVGYTIQYGHIVDEGHSIDEVLVSFFKNPHSYTKENMCEINSHGGSYIVRRILELCIKNGARIAEPGEFTKRAFLNGRIDLSQAEAVMELIQSKSEKEARASIQQLEGDLSREIKRIRDGLMELMVEIEVSIDYPEYDVEEVNLQRALTVIERSKKELTKLKNSFQNGKLIKEGINVALIGKPNVGKSSLLNALLREDRAIVTELEGTTRDVIKESITIEGIPINIIDTAGIRKSTNEVEKIGIERSRKMADQSDLIVAILDCSRELQKEDKEILELTKQKKSIIVLNKIDKLEQKINVKEIKEKKLNSSIIPISVREKIGIEELYSEIIRLFNLNEIEIQNTTIITNLRHKEKIQLAEEHVEKAVEAIKQGLPIDLISISVKEAMQELGKITGESVSDEIIKEIFSKFCLGK